jgi:hypothetical protein
MPPGAKLEDISAAITAAYAEEDEEAAREHRQRLHEAEQEVVDLGHRAAAREQRIERAQRAFDTFKHERSRDLLEERAVDAKKLTIDLIRAGHEVVRLNRAYATMRAEVDDYVRATPGAVVRMDGVPASHPWEPAIRDLERAVRETPEIDPPAPRWTGLEHRKRADLTTWRMKLQRKSKLTREEQTQLDRLEREIEGVR